MGRTNKKADVGETAINSLHQFTEGFNVCTLRDTAGLRKFSPETLQALRDRLPANEASSGA